MKVLSDKKMDQFDFNSTGAEEEDDNLRIYFENMKKHWKFINL